MIEGKISTGFKYEISEDRLDDYEFLELLSESNEDPGLFPKMARMFLGDEQHKRLVEHLRNESGKVSTEKMVDAMTEIFENAQKVKNS